MLALGSSIDGKFEVVRKLGEGGFGAVFLARQLVFDRMVAVKVMKDDDTDQESLQRFEREAKLLSGLSHPNIAMFVGFGVTDGFRYTAMEYIAGEPLEAYVTRKGSLRAGEAFAILRQILSALAHAHSHGIVHRDLKPANIMIDQAVSGIANAGVRIKLIDFGLAHVSDSARSQRLTREGCAIGTVMYMAPEQCVGQGVDARTDIYAAGCILYFMLTGRPPYEGDAAVTVMFKHMNEERPHLVGDDDSTLDNFIGRFLAKEKEKRFESADEALNELETIAKIVDDTHLSVGATKPISASAFGGRRGLNQAGMVAICAAVVLSLGLLVFGVGIRLLAPNTPPLVLPERPAANVLADMPPQERKKVLLERIAAIEKALPKVIAEPDGDRKQADKDLLESELRYVVEKTDNADNDDESYIAAHAYMVLAKMPWFVHDLQMKYGRLACNRLFLIGGGTDLRRMLDMRLEAVVFAKTIPAHDRMTDQVIAALLECKEFVRKGKPEFAVELIKSAPLERGHMDLPLAVLTQLMDQRDYGHAVELATYLLDNPELLTRYDLNYASVTLSQALERLWFNAWTTYKNDRALELSAIALKRFDPQTTPADTGAKWLILHAAALQTAGRFEESEKLLNQAYQIGLERANYPIQIWALRDLAKCYARTNRYTRALDISNQGLELLKDHPEGNDPRLLKEMRQEHDSIAAHAKI